MRSRVHAQPCRLKRQLVTSHADGLLPALAFHVVSSFRASVALRRQAYCAPRAAPSCTGSGGSFSQNQHAPQRRRGRAAPGSARRPRTKGQGPAWQRRRGRPFKTAGLTAPRSRWGGRTAAGPRARAPAAAPFLPMPPAIAGQAPVRPHDAVAGHDDGDLVAPHRAAHRLGGHARQAPPGGELPGDRAIGRRLSVGDWRKGAPTPRSQRPCP